MDQQQLFSKQQPEKGSKGSGVPSEEVHGSLRPFCYTDSVVPLQVIDGYISVFEAMTQMGYTRPGTYWKELLGKHNDTLPEHKMMQFIKANGRKGRKIPAIRKEDLDRLLAHFDVMMVASQDVFDREVVEDVLRTLSLAFQDFGPERDLRVGEHRIDLYLHEARLVIDFLPAQMAKVRLSALLQREKDLRAQLGCTFMRIDPQAENFHVGQVIFLLRQQLRL